MADLMNSVAQGYAIGKDVRQRRDAKKLQKEMDGLFNDFNNYAKFDDEAALPDAAAPASAAQALPINDAGTTVAAAAMSAAPGGPPASAVDPAIDLGAAPAAPKKLRTQSSYDDLNNIHSRIAKVASLSGDPKVLTALQDTFATQVRGRALNYLAEAQKQFTTTNDVDATEKSLKNMAKLFPATSGLSFTRKDGQLVFKNPLNEGAEEPVTAETMGLMYKMLSSPEVVYDLIGSKREAKRKEGLEGRAAVVSETNAATNRQNAETQAAQQRETERSNKATQPSENRARDANALQSLALADYYSKGGGKGGGDGEGEMDPNKARQFAGDVRTVVQDTIFPQTQVQDAAGAWVKAPGTAIPGYENATPEDVNRVSSYAEQIGISNPTTGLSTAGQSAIEIDRVLRGDRSSGRGLQVLSDGTVQLTSKSGPPITFKANPQLQQMIMQAAKARQIQPQGQPQGLPMGLQPPSRTNAQGIPLSIAR